jgi:hypothetical protein
MSTQLYYNYCPFTQYSYQYYLTGSEQFSVDVTDVNTNTTSTIVSGTLVITTSSYVNTNGESFQQSIYVTNYVYDSAKGLINDAGDTGYNFNISISGSVFTLYITGILSTSTATAQVTLNSIWYNPNVVSSPYSSLGVQNYFNGFTVFSLQAPYNGVTLYIPTVNNSTGFVYGISVSYGGDAYGTPGSYDPSGNVLTMLDAINYLTFFTKFYNNNGSVTLKGESGWNVSIGNYNNNITVGGSSGYSQIALNWFICMCAAGPFPT